MTHDPDPEGPLETSSNFVRTLARWMFHTHLWVGMIATALVIVVSTTGILLNHKQMLGYQPDPPAAETVGLVGAMAMADLVAAAMAHAGAEVATAGIDRLDVRPDNGLMKVRFADRVVTEVTVAIHTGEILSMGERNDVFLEKLHSGEIFGDNGILLSDALAVGLLILLLSGTWMWLYPKARM